MCEEKQDGVVLKQCFKCKEFKPLEDFRPRPSSKDGRRGVCRICQRKQKNENFQKNIEVCRDKARQYYEKNKQRLQDYHKQYYLDDRQKFLDRAKQYAESNKDRIVEYKKRYHELNRFDAVAAEHYKKAEARGLIADLTEQQWNDCLAYFNYECAYCGDSSQRVLCQEHVIPVSKMGNYTASNIVPACASCNSRKRSRYFVEWFKSTEFFSQEKLYRIVEYLQQMGANFG